MQNIVTNGTKREIHRKSSRVNSNANPYNYLAPALISIFILTFLPIVYTVVISFTNYSLNTMHNVKLIGIDNFKDILSGPFTKVFLPVFGWTFIFAIVSTFGCFLIGLILALLLNDKNMKEAPVYKAILVLPWALPATIAVLSWQGLLNAQYGAINIALMHLHIISKPIQWLTSPTLAKVGVLMATLWLGFPYMMNVCMGSLSAIPDDYYEAAEIDGASAFTKFFKITLPSITRTAYPLLISSFAFNFNNFGSAFLITQGGPPRPTSQYAGYTDILASTIYNMSMTYNRYALGAAMSIILFFIIAIISYVQMRASGQFKEVE